jgi:FKBP-type peptidyl-prolyl cis-trans isomerase 2
MLRVRTQRRLTHQAELLTADESSIRPARERVAGDTVKADANHLLAGQALTFEIELVAAD